MSRRRNYEAMNSYQMNDERIEATSLAQKEMPEFEEVPHPRIRKGVIANSRAVNVRKGPSPSSDVVQVLDRGDKVKILDEIQGYYKIQIEDETSIKNEIGYVSLDFCKEAN